MGNQYKNAMIGLFVLVAVGIFIYILLFLHPTVGDDGQKLRVRFTNIDKISIGTRVLFAGFPVGEVTNIEEVENARVEGINHDGEVYIYQLTIRIDSGVRVYTIDDVSSSTSGLLGERTIVINPTAPKKGEKLVRVTDQIIYATPTTSVEDVIEIVGELTERVNEGLATLENDRFWENLSGVAENIYEFTETLDQGTIGRLFGSDDLYLQMTSLLSKGETIMDDINHYGILFNTSKAWQRMRARRVNLMNELSNPQEFSNFFTDEINQISTALSRVNMVLNMEDCACYWSMFCGPEFESVFAELLRRIENMEDNVKLVNQKIVDERRKCCGRETHFSCPIE